MMKLKHWIIIWISVLIATPIICNFIVQTPRHPCINVAGTEETWVTFLGSYVGTVIASLISFIILWYNRHDNVNQIKAQMEINHLKDEIACNWSEVCGIQKEISDRFKQFDLSTMINLHTICKKSPKALTSNSPELQSLYAKHHGLKQSAILLYAREENYACQKFMSKYIRLMDMTLELISQYIIYITSLTDRDTFLDTEKDIIEFSRKAELYQEYNNNEVMESAQEYICQLIAEHHCKQDKLKQKIDKIKLENNI